MSGNTTPVEVTFAASDLGSGVKTINWRIDGSGGTPVYSKNTLNLAGNPSFENSSSPPISGWVFRGNRAVLVSKIVQFQSLICPRQK